MEVYLKEILWVGGNMKKDDIIDVEEIPPCDFCEKNCGNSWCVTNQED